MSIKQAVSIWNTRIKYKINQKSLLKHIQKVFVDSKVLILKYAKKKKSSAKAKFF